MRGHAAPQDIGIIDGRIAAGMGREEEVIGGRLVLPGFVIPMCILRSPACSAVAAVSGADLLQISPRAEIYSRLTLSDTQRLTGSLNK